MNRIDISMIISASVVIMIMMVVPFLNIIFSNEYITEGRVSLTERISILNAIGEVVLS